MDHKVSDRYFFGILLIELNKLYNDEPFARFTNSVQRLCN